MPLPDVPLGLWIADQQKRFAEATSPLWDALQFEQTGRAVQAEIPTDWPLPGGEDQWQQAEQERIAQEQRIADQQAEQARLQQEEELRKQFQAQQEQIRQQQEAAAMQQASSLGIPSPESIGDYFSQAAAGIAANIPTPDSIASYFTQATQPQPAPEPTMSPPSMPVRPVSPSTDNASSALWPAEPTPQLEPTTSPPSPTLGTPTADHSSSALWPDFGGMAQGITRGIGDVIGQVTPPAEPSPEPPPSLVALDNRSSALWPSLGEAVQTGTEALGSARQTLTGTPEQREQVNQFTREASGQQPPVIDNREQANQFAAEASGQAAPPVYDLGGTRGLLNIPEQYGIGRVERESRELEELEREVDEATGAGILGSQLEGRDESTWRAVNPEKATKLDELRESKAGLIMGASGTMGGGGMARDGIEAIKALRVAGLTDEAMQVAKGLAEKTSMTLDDILRETGLASRAAPAPAAAEAVTETVAEAVAPRPTPRFPDPDRAARDVPGGMWRSAQEAGTRATSEAASKIDDMPVSGKKVASGKTVGFGKTTDLADETVEELQRAREEHLQSPAGQPQTAEMISEELDKSGINPLEVAARAHPTRSRQELQAVREAGVGAVNRLVEKRRQLRTEDLTPEQRQEIVDDIALIGEHADVLVPGAQVLAAAAARTMQSLRTALSGGRANDQYRNMHALFSSMKRAPDKIIADLRKGQLSPETIDELETLLAHLKNPKRVARPTDDVLDELDRLEGVTAAERGGGKAGGTGRRGTAAAKPPEESLGERLGRLKREQGRLEESQAPPMARAAVTKQIDDTLAEIREIAERDAQVMLRNPKKNINDLPEAEREKILNKAVGQRTVARIRREAREEASGVAAARRQEGLTKGFEKAIDKDLRGQQRADLQQQIADARIMAKAAQMAPSDTGLRSLLDEHLTKLEGFSDEGAAAAKNLREKITVDRDEGLFRFLSDVEKRNADDARKIMADVEQRNAAAARRLELEVRERNAQQTIKDARKAERETEDATLDKIREGLAFVLRNPNSRGAAQRLQELYADMTTVGARGFEESVRFKERLFKTRLQHAGLNTKDLDLGPFIQAFEQLDPKNPGSIKGVLETLTGSSKWKAYEEMQYINMLSDPSTHLRNIAGIAANTGVKLLFRNPIESVLGAVTGQDTRGTRKAWRGYGEAIRPFARDEDTGKWGLSPNARRVKQIMWTGIDPQQVEEAIEGMNIGRLPREHLAEQMGPARKFGEFLHATATRPLRAMDAYFGSALENAVLEQEISRKASALMREKSADVAGMNRAQAEAHVKANIWNYEDVIGHATRERKRALLQEENAVTKWLGDWDRKAADPALSRSERNQARFYSTIIKMVMPFRGVPINFATQGLGYTVGAPISLVKAGVHAAKGEGRLAVENMSHAAVGTTMIAGASALAFDVAGTGADITLDGPEDAGQRRVWLETHRPRSFRLHKDGDWVSWENLPITVPFAAVAGAKEAVEAAERQAGKKGLSPEERALGVGWGLAEGFAKGITSNIFLEGVQQNIEFLTGESPGMTSTAATAAGMISRYNPLPTHSGMMAFLARTGDQMDRDAGRVYNADEIPQNILDRLALRTPGHGLPGELSKGREDIEVRRGAFGEPVENISSGLAALRPVRAGQAYAGGDPELERMATKLEELGVGLPPAPEELTINTLPLELTTEERREFQQAWSENMLELMRHFEGREYPKEAYDKLRDAARKQAQAQVMRTIGNEELLRRLNERRLRIEHPVR